MSVLAEKIKNWLGQLKMKITGAGAPGEDEYDIRLRKHRRTMYIRTILICTAGEGWYQEWEKAPRALKPGDVVMTAPPVKEEKEEETKGDEVKRKAKVKGNGES